MSHPKQNQETNEQGPGFIHLRIHSAFSLLEGALKFPRLVDFANKDLMPALALTDRNNLFGALEFSETLSSAGIQPIIGCTLNIVFDDEKEKDESILNGVGGLKGGNGQTHQDIAGSIALFAQSDEGYANLMKLSSRAFLDNASSGQIHVSADLLASACDGLIALTGGPDGPVDSALGSGDQDLAKKRLIRLTQIFKDKLYVEIQRHGSEREKTVEPNLLNLAYAHNLPIVATNQAYFATRDDYNAHDALLCIADGRYVSEDDRRRLTPNHCLKTRAEMMDLFQDLPEALENTVEIAKRCAFRPTTRDPILPAFVAPSDQSEDPDKLVLAEADELKKLAEQGLKLQLKAHGLADGYSEKDYKDRLAYELDIIAKMKYPGYFLIVADFIQWAKNADIPVGPGRGSGAGSVVAWALTITDLDPLRFGLLFERFLNPERISMPDFDIDFCQERRDEVIRYVQNKYGKDRVAQIITFGTLQARAVLRDVGRVLHMPYGQVDRLCKLVPNNPAQPVTLAEAVAGEPKLQEARAEEAVVQQLLDVAQRLEGLYRHASTHAAGIVIGDRPLSELVPLYQDPRSDLPATQFNMNWVEPAGLVKFDFLGLKTLSVIQHAVMLLRAKGVDLDLSALPLDDVPTYEMLCRGDTVGVFQFESSGMRDLLRQAEPSRFEDLIALVALFRPGPMENIPKYLACKHGREEPLHLHDMVESIVAETYGVIIYQEQVMQIAQALSGYTLGEADILRKAMGKKKKEEMDRQKSRFVEGAVAKGVDKKQADYIFEMVAKFAGYGFNKAHSACYALVAYQTAYLKAKHPVEFLSAIMTLDQGNTDKINQFCQDAAKLEIEIKGPDVNKSTAEFVPEDGAIRFSLAALKNVGQGAVEHLCEIRQSSGQYSSLTDFASKINPRNLNKRALETLAAAGAFDGLEQNRAIVLENADRILAAANRFNDDKAQGQNDLFAGGDKPQDIGLKQIEAWLPMDKLTREFEAIGFFLSGHPLDEYGPALQRLKAMNWVSFVERVQQGEKSGLLAATVTYRQDRKSKNGNNFAFAGFSDPTGQYEAVVFSETLAASRDLLEPGSPVLMRVDAELDGETVKTRILTVEALENAARRVQPGLKIVMDTDVDIKGLKSKYLRPGQGKLTFVLKLDEQNRDVELILEKRYDVSPQFVSRLKTLKGVLQIDEVQDL